MFQNVPNCPRTIQNVQKHPDPAISGLVRLRRIATRSDPDLYPVLPDPDPAKTGSGSVTQLLFKRQGSGSVQALPPTPLE